MVDGKKIRRVLINGKEELGQFLVVDFVHSILKTSSLLYPVDFPDKALRRIPIDRVRYVDSSSFMTTRDFFLMLLMKHSITSNVLLSDSLFYYNVEYQPYQFRPLLKFLANDRRRLLIADETGLGKTIETAYILVNEMLRSRINRIVILCPSNLCQKWRNELFLRFGVHFSIVSGKEALRGITQSSSPINYIVSMDAGRSIDLSQILKCRQDHMIDLLIIDEIQNLIGRTGETIRRNLGNNLSLISHGVIGLSATPIQIELTDFFRILTILDPDEITLDEFSSFMSSSPHLTQLVRMLDSQLPVDSQDLLKLLRKYVSTIKKTTDVVDSDIVELEKKLSKKHLNDFERLQIKEKLYDFLPLSKYYTRTTRGEVGLDLNRNVQNVTVDLDDTPTSLYQDGELVTISELGLYSEIEQIFSKSFNYVHRRQLSSSLPAIVNLLRGGVHGVNVWVRGEVKNYDLSLTKEEMDECLRAANKFGIISKDSKWDKFNEVISDLIENKDVKKIIVFTQWMSTLNYFKSKQDYYDYNLYFVSGDEDQYQKNEIIKKFKKDDHVSIMFSTDVLSEGIDLQFSNCIVNYDLPYNPARLEQRIGRIDRIGQKSKNLYVVNMLVNGSDDHIIFERLYERIKIFESYIGSLPSSIEEKEVNREIDDSYINKIVEDKLMEIDLNKKNMPLMLSDYYDKVTETVREKIHEDLYDIRPITIYLMFKICFNLEPITMNEKRMTYDSIGIEELEVLTNIVDHRNKEYVSMQFMDYIDKNNALSFVFDSNEEGVYLPLSHSLLHNSLSIISEHCERLFASQKRFTLHCDDKFSSYQCLFLVQYDYLGASLQKRDTRWWALTSDDEFECLSDLDLSTMVNSTISPAVDDSLMNKYQLSIGPCLEANYEQWYSESLNEDWLKCKQIEYNRIRWLKTKLKQNEEISEERDEIIMEMNEIQHRLDSSLEHRSLSISNFYKNVNILSIVQLHSD